MTRKDIWYLHYEFGIHHVDVQATFNQIKIIVNELSKEFEIHQEFYVDGWLKEIWIYDYLGNKFTIARRV